MYLQIVHYFPIHPNGKQHIRSVHDFLSSLRKCTCKGSSLGACMCVCALTTVSTALKIMIKIATEEMLLRVLKVKLQQIVSVYM